MFSVWSLTELIFSQFEAFGTEIWPNSRCKNWTFPWFWDSEMQFFQKVVISGEGRVLKNWQILKWGSQGMVRRVWKGGLKGGTYRIPFSGEYPPRDSMHFANTYNHASTTCNKAYSHTFSTHGHNCTYSVSQNLRQKCHHFFTCNFLSPFENCKFQSIVLLLAHRAFYKACSSRLCWAHLDLHFKSMKV